MDDSDKSLTPLVDLSKTTVLLERTLNGSVAHSGGGNVPRYTRFEYNGDPLDPCRN